MKKFAFYIAAAFFLGLIAIFIAFIIWVYGLNASGASDLYAIYHLICYTVFLVVLCTGVIVAKIDQLRDDLRKK